jgi:alpha-galactosidase
MIWLLLNTALARLGVVSPPMGFNTWNHFKCDINEDLMKETVNEVITLGLAAVGYNYINLDDCWSTMQRDPVTKRLIADPIKFPSGIKALADYIHSKGLKFGIYADSGMKTCKGYPGSANFEDVDAQTFADWGVDYLKYDNCYTNPFLVAEKRYKKMSEALERAYENRPGGIHSIFFSICNWGQEAPHKWAGPLGDSWRVTGDIGDLWELRTIQQRLACPCVTLWCPKFVISGGHDCSILNILDKIAEITDYTGDLGFNDPDMLEVGNGGMNTNQYRSHFSFWAALKAPLLIGTDLRKVSRTDLEILLNRDVIAVNQDPLRKSIRRFKNIDHGSIQVWAGPLEGGKTVVLILNVQNYEQVIKIDLSDLGLSGFFRTKELWTKQESDIEKSIAETIAPHDTWMAILTPK